MTSTSWLWDYGLGGLIAAGAIAIGYVFFSIALGIPNDPHIKLLCDKAVEALLGSKDLVEIQRAGIIIREVNCSITRRLP